MGSRENSRFLRGKINNPYRSFMCSSHQVPEANLKIQMKLSRFDMVAQPNSKLI
jgi:hypothetical protein